MTKTAAISPDLKPDQYTIRIRKARPDEKTGQVKAICRYAIKRPDWVPSLQTIKDLVTWSWKASGPCPGQGPRMVNNKTARRIGRRRTHRLAQPLDQALFQYSQVGPSGAPTGTTG
ncbi:hypothetical protein CLCR_04440 [Cladophialophora carrionii]|uniref:Uncharacterized protein n=1 Tax=Cladophialophora carrionii TaxID=86049 RepID=A0A1C1CJB2_9EURO|nr:hypothetical protein CLCR_04440 [Cladophialophora carrionii]